MVCLSAICDNEHVTERLGIPCLAKPVDFDELVRLVTQACSA